MQCSREVIVRGIVLTLREPRRVTLVECVIELPSLGSCISLYSTRSGVHGVSGRHCVSVVLIRCLPMDTPYILGYVVDRGRDTPVEFFVVHSSNIGASRVRLRRKNKLCS